MTPFHARDATPCLGKRRYATQGDALDAVAVLGLERQRSAYFCPHCERWHLTTK